MENLKENINRENINALSEFGNRLNIVIPTGLNQIYTHVQKKYVSCEQIFKNFLEDKYAGQADDILKITMNWSNNQENSKGLWETIKEKYKSEAENISGSFSEFVKNVVSLHKEFNIIDKEIIEEITNSGYSIISIHENKLSYYIESLILSHLPLYEKMINLKIKDKDFLSQIASNPKEFTIFDNHLSRLLEFKEKGCWTAFLTHTIFTNFYVLKKANPFYPLIEENIKIIKDYGRFFNFSTHTFFQLRNYYKYMAEINKHKETNSEDCHQLLEEKINQTNPVRVLCIYKSFFKKGELKKTLHYTSNEKVFFISHCAGNIDEGDFDLKLEVNGNFNVILARLSEAQEVKSYSKLLAEIEAYPLKQPEVLLLNSSRNLPNLMNRDLMISFINNFCLSEKLQQLSKEYNTRVLVPHCYPVTLNEVYEADQLRQFLKNNNLQLPLIIKYTGPRTDYNHLLVTIITDQGLDNYVSFMKSYSQGQEDQISMVIQAYVNHGGYVIKLYRVNRKGVIYMRPSLPDVSEDLVKEHSEYGQGFYKIYTNELVSQEYTEFWKKLAKNQKVLDSINHNLLNKVSEIFELYSHMTLFGLDFLYDIDKNEYYLVDCNNFPGYKELVNEFNSWIIEHVLTYHNQFKQNGKIFN